jgi:hypothetical protein
MKLYCKIKIDGIWQWYVGDDPWKVATARALCECRVCRPAKPNVVSQEEVSHVGHIVSLDAAGNQTCLTCGEDEE